MEALVFASACRADGYGWLWSVVADYVVTVGEALELRLDVANASSDRS